VTFDIYQRAIERKLNLFRHVCKMNNKRDWWRGCIWSNGRSK